MIELTTPEQFDALTGRFLVLFTASWCGPCRRMDKEILEEAANEKSVPVYYSDDTVNPDLSKRFGISRVPTFCLFSGKDLVGTKTSSDSIRVLLWLRGIL